ncbi:MAG: single-stranded-DNA-specific exonuclease RecJ [Lachnospiraceae bacterium]|nr:single-stranded-DNA-specific exonuclease RecJ [Lachnospiraceae bacterium]
MEKWFISAKKADFNSIAEKFGIDPVTARLIRNRDIVGDREIEEYLHGDISMLHSPLLMKNMGRAAEILGSKIADGAHIRVIGDYDIDGIMSSYILKRGLSELGASVDLTIPDRIQDGYGVSDSMIRKAHAEGIDTVVTCDNGISASDQVKLAKSLGMTVIVTDHHEVLKAPEADAVVDPKQEGDSYPYKNLCGAAIAWKLIQAMGGKTEDLLQYAAFATVGDIVDLTGENRIIVKEGLERIRHTDNLGLRKLMAVNGLRPEAVDPYSIGFVLGPCLNASGRLDTAMRAYGLLNARDEAAAERIAGELKSLNDSRKAMTEEGVAQAEKLLAEGGCSKDRIYVLYLPECHESLAGIIAGRIREKYGHPTFVLTDAENGLKGSGRSTEAYSMFEGLVKCADLFTKFGGHPMAAGISLPAENLEPFRKKINETCTLSEEDLVPKVLIDVPMPFSYLTEGLLEEMNLLEPFGKGNPKPVFAMKDVTAENVRVLGAKGNVLKMRLLLPDGRHAEGIAFRNAGELMERIRRNPKIDIVYYPTLNEFNGRKTLQAVITHFR